MGLFKRKGEIIEDTPEKDGKVLVRITVDRISRQESKVKVIIIERSTGKTLYKLRFTGEKNEYACYSASYQYVKSFIEDNNYVIDGEISTNVVLPFVGMSDKRSR